MTRELHKTNAQEAPAGVSAGRSTRTLEPMSGIGFAVPPASIGQYEVIREIGRGGMGRVYQARDTKLGRLVALKFLTTTSTKLSERLLAEARATAQCSHENIVVVHEVNEHEGTPYMVLEYLEGESLTELLDRGPFPPSRAVELVISVVTALVRAHEFGIAHRDLKPDNIFVTRSGRVKVLDFGIASLLRDAGSGQATTTGGTLDGALIGTPAYMSPEQLGVGTIDQRADLWAVGTVLFELIAGKPPLAALELDELVAAAQARTLSIPFLSKEVPGVSLELSQVVSRCLQPDKRKRYASAGELLSALERLVTSASARTAAIAVDNPYPGLVAFDEGASELFFGRTRETARLVSRLRDQALVAIVGPSGAGKSSFVRAGVIPALREQGNWDAHILRAGKSPLKALAKVIAEVTGVAQEGMHSRLADEPGLAGALLRDHCNLKQCQLLVFIDQFEELYTLSAQPDAEAFSECIAGVADDASSPLRVIVSLRSDFLDRAAEDSLFADELSRRLLFMRAPGRQGLQDALVQPAALLGYSFESTELVDDILDALDGTTGALPLLQFAASKMWECRDREQGLITRVMYDKIGGVEGALATHADEALGQHPTRAQKLIRAIFVRLVTAEGTRDVVDLIELEHLGEASDVRRLVDTLVDARLLSIENSGESEVPAVELVHESMIRGWPTLKRWLDESQEDSALRSELRAAAKQWQARGREPGLLWRGRTLERSQRWRERSDLSLTEREMQFLDAATDVALRTARRRRTAAVGSFAFLILLVAAASVALVVIRQAKNDAMHAEEGALNNASKAREETARALAAERRVSEQLASLEEKERQRQSAENSARSARDRAGKSEEALETANSQLQEALRTATAERGKAMANAEQATRSAQEAKLSAAAVQKANKELQSKYREEQRRRREIEKAHEEISTDLK